MDGIKRDVINSDAAKLIPLTDLINLLVANALGTLEIPLDQTRLHTIKILLAKCMPDLKAIEHSGEVQGTWQLKL